MAVTQTVTVRRMVVEGDRKQVEADLTFSGTYATGGHAVTAAQFGLTTLEGIQQIGGVGAAIFDHVGSTMRLYVPTTGAEVANAADPAAQKARVRVIGT